MIKTNIVQCYSPTNDNTDGTKEEFCNQLHDIHFGDNNVKGDFNGEIGSNNQGYENVMGLMSNNGEQFLMRVLQISL